jgi:hypothetical protein
MVSSRTGSGHRAACETALPVSTRHNVITLREAAAVLEQHLLTSIRAYSLRMGNAALGAMEFGARSPGHAPGHATSVGRDVLRDWTDESFAVKEGGRHMTRLLWVGAFLSVIFYLVAEWSYANGQAGLPTGVRSDSRQVPGGPRSVAVCDAAPAVIGLRNGGRWYSPAPEHG